MQEIERNNGSKRGYSSLSLCDSHALSLSLPQASLPLFQARIKAQEWPPSLAASLPCSTTTATSVTVTDAVTTTVGASISRDSTRDAEAPVIHSPRSQ